MDAAGPRRFLHRRINSLQKAFINHPELCGALFMMDECILLFFYWIIENQQPFNAIINLERARTFFFTTLIVFV